MNVDIKEDEKKMAKNVLIITDIAPGDKSGCGTNGNMHCRMICSIEELNVYSMYITNSAVQQDKHSIKVYESSKAEKLTSVLSGYPPYLNRRVRKRVFRIILEKKISIVYLDNSVSGKLIEDIKRQYPEIKIIAFVLLRLIQIKQLSLTNAIKINMRKSIKKFQMQLSLLASRKLQIFRLM